MLPAARNKATLSILGKLRQRGAPGAPDQPAAEESDVTPQTSMQTGDDELAPTPPPAEGEDPNAPDMGEESEALPPQQGVPAPAPIQPEAPMSMNQQLTNEKKRKQLRGMK